LWLPEGGHKGRPYNAFFSQLRCPGLGWIAALGLIIVLRASYWLQTPEP
jgi:hypothetical protein